MKDFGQHMRLTNRLAATTFVLAGALGMIVPAGAQNIPSPTTPTLITPPAGNTAFLVGHATGTQGYICLPTGPGATAAS